MSTYNPMLALVAALSGGAGGLAEGMDDDRKRAEADAAQRSADEERKSRQAQANLTFHKDLNDQGYRPADDVVNQMVATGQQNLASMPIATTPAATSVKGPDGAMLQLVAPRSKPQPAPPTATSGLASRSETFTDPAGVTGSYVRDKNETQEARALRLVAEKTSAEEAARIHAETAKSAETKQTFIDRQRADFNTLAAEFPDSALAKRPFDEKNPADYSAALVSARADRHDAHTAAAAAAKAAVASPEQTKKFNADQANKILDDYSRDTKDFHQVMGGWGVLQGAVKDPSLATPFAVTDAYARITNPGAIVRPTTLDMINQMGSVGQRMQKWWSQHADGALPPDILHDFQQTLYNIVAEHKKQFDQIRTKAIKRGHDAGLDVTPYLEDYTANDPSAAPAGQSGGVASKYGITPSVP
jgi:hypothetical protein